jgi:chromosome segregation ATPase
MSDTPRIVQEWMNGDIDTGGCVAGLARELAACQGREQGKQIVIEQLERELAEARTIHERLREERWEQMQRAERAEAALEECRRDAERYQKLCTEFRAENSKLRSALELVHFKREPWQ